MIVVGVAASISAAISCAAIVATSVIRMSVISASAVSRMAVVAIPVIAISVVAVSAIAIVATSVIPVIPGTGADKYAADKVARPVVTIGCAGIRGVVIVAVGADRRWPVGRVVVIGVTVVAAYADANRNLCRRACSDEEQHSQHCDIFQIRHGPS